MSEGFPYKTCKQLVKHNLLAGQSVLLLGSPGVGKSSMAKELAEELNLPLTTIHLAHHSPEEIMGGLFPERTINISIILDPEKMHNGYYSNLEESIKKINEVYERLPKKNEVGHFKPYWVPTDKPAFVFLDEINCGVTKLHQSIAYQIVLEHRVGPFKFHPGSVVMAAGNLEEDNAIVTPLSSALNNRFCHFTLSVNADAWLEWAAKKELSPDGRSYIAWRREPVLYNNNGERAWPSPRSWANALMAAPESLLASKSGKDYDKAKLTRKRIISGFIGEAATNEFFTYLDVYRSVDVEGILDDGKIPNFNNSDLSFIYASVFAVASYINNKKFKDKWFDNLAAFVSAPGLYADMQAMFFNQLNYHIIDKLIKSGKFESVASRLVDILTSK